MFRGRTWPLAATAFLALSSTPAHAAGPQCGAVVVKSTSLRADLTDCPGDGLVIGADGITLDLDGHAIRGTETGVGLRLADHHGVTIRDGALEGFETGVLLDAATGNVVHHVTVRGTSGRGVQLQNGSDGNRLEAVDSSSTGRSGFGVFDSSRNVLLRLTASDNPFNGLFATGSDDNLFQNGVFTRNEVGFGFGEGSDGNRVFANLATDNTFVGLAIGGSRNTATANRVSRNGANVIVDGERNVVSANVSTDAKGCPDGGCGAGISLEGGVGNVIAGNSVTRPLMQGIKVDEFVRDGGPPAVGNVVRANVVRDAGSDGIAIGTSTDENSGGGEVKDNVVEANVVIGSARDGINVARAANTVRRNVVLRNGALGIDAVEGVIDGGGNIAHLNGDPRQCLRIACH